MRASVSASGCISPSFPPAAARGSRWSPAACAITRRRWKRGDRSWSHSRTTSKQSDSAELGELLLEEPALRLGPCELECPAVRRASSARVAEPLLEIRGSGCEDGAVLETLI